VPNFSRAIASLVVKLAIAASRARAAARAPSRAPERSALPLARRCAPERGALLPAIASTQRIIICSR